MRNLNILVVIWPCVSCSALLAFFGICSEWFKVFLSILGTNNRVSYNGAGKLLIGQNKMPHNCMFYQNKRLMRTLLRL